MITFFRIDDRLIHGQIATTWIRHVNPDVVVLADDKTASNSMFISLQKMSAPKDYPLYILTVADAIERLNNDLKEKKVFLLVGSVEAAKQIVNSCETVELNLGNLGYKEGYEKLVKRLFVNGIEKEALNSVLQRGVRIYAQMLPSESIIEITSDILR